LTNALSSMSDRKLPDVCGKKPTALGDIDGQYATGGMFFNGFPGKSTHRTLIVITVDGGPVTQVEKSFVPSIAKNSVADLRRRGYGWESSTRIVWACLPTVKDLVSSLRGNRQLVHCHATPPLGRDNYSKPLNFKVWPRSGGQGVSLLKVDVDKALQEDRAVLDSNLLSAAVLGDFSTVDFLIKRGANVNALGHGNASCVLYACKNIAYSDAEGRPELLKVAWLLIQSKGNVNQPPTIYVGTPLRTVIRNGDLAIVKMLFHSKVDVHNAVMGKDAKTTAIDFVKKRIQQDIIEVGDWVVIDKDQKSRSKGYEKEVISAGSVGMVTKVSDSGSHYVHFLLGYDWVKAHVKAKINEYTQILDLLPAPETACKLKSEEFLSCPLSVSGPVLLEVAQLSK